MDAQTDFIIMGKMDCDTSNLKCRLDLSETRHILEDIIFKSVPINGEYFDPAKKDDMLTDEQWGERKWNESPETKRLAGNRAHVFFWLSGPLYDQDPEMKWLEAGLFEGIKLHEGETPWMKCRKKALRKIMSVAAERNLRIMLHGGLDVGCRPYELAKVAHAFPSVRLSDKEA